MSCRGCGMGGPAGGLLGPPPGACDCIKARGWQTRALGLDGAHGRWLVAAGRGSPPMRHACPLVDSPLVHPAAPPLLADGGRVAAGWAPLSSSSLPPLLLHRRRHRGARPPAWARARPLPPPVPPARPPPHPVRHAAWATPLRCVRPCAPSARWSCGHAARGLADGRGVTGEGGVRPGGPGGARVRVGAVRLGGAWGGWAGARRRVRTRE